MQLNDDDVERSKYHLFCLRRDCQTHLAAYFSRPLPKGKVAGLPDFTHHMDLTTAWVTELPCRKSIFQNGWHLAGQSREGAASQDGTVFDCTFCGTKSVAMFWPKQNGTAFTEA